MLATSLAGIDFPNPVGLAPGFDKDARVPHIMPHFGFGFVEVGTLTPLAQAGNPRPRLFRLTADRAVVNRMGFNNQGMEAMAGRLEAFRRGALGRGIVGVNLGRNKDTVDEAADYVAGIDRLGRFASYLVVNVSSPNTPGLRLLQDKAPLTRLLASVKTARDGLAQPRKPPLLVKIAPDLAAEDIADVAAVALDLGIDGIIATNTTISRPDSLTDPRKAEAGGLSGAPLKDMSQDVLAQLYRQTQGRLPLIGVGGIASAADAYARIRAGASLVQFYSAMVYEGPYLAARIADGLAALLARDGIAHVADAVGAGNR